MLCDLLNPSVWKTVGRFVVISDVHRDLREVHSNC